MNDKEKIFSEKQIRNKTLYSFLYLIIFFAICLSSWKWLHHQPKEQGALKPLRAGLNTNEFIFSRLFSNDHFSKIYSLSAAEPRVRVNGDAGMNENFDPASWKLQVVKNEGDTLHISLEDLKKLPKTEIIFDFKCIEGWSQVTHWGGVRFSDFVKKYDLDKQAQLQFTGLITPDEEYYVGIDNTSMMHPQTILCYEMNDAPLPMNQGYPLRLIIPVKYGIKNLKRIGTIFFSSQRPPDYWFERGYDYYSGL